MDETTLESLVDLHGLREVLNTLSIICLAKADHIASNYNDQSLAADWDAAARHIDQCADKLRHMRL